MRKNRFNNGYIGNDALFPFSGCIAPSNVSIFSSNEMDIVDVDFTPIGDDGYGATASVQLTSGELIGVYITDHTMGGTGYVVNTNRFSISGGGGPTAWGLVSAVNLGTVNGLSLQRGVDFVTISDAGQGYTSAPTLTFQSGIASSSFTASKDGVTLNVTSVSSGTIIPNSLLAGTGVSSGTIIIDFGTGRGGTGTYTTNKSETLSSRSMTTSTTATAVATIAGDRLSGVSMTYPGVYYQGFTLISQSGNPSAPGSLVPVMERFYGYTASPTITFYNPPSGSGSTAFGATASALIVYDIASINVVSGGQSYSSAPSVIIQGAENSGTVATATLSGGTVSQITALTGGVLFTSVPDVQIGGLNLELPSVTGGENKFVGRFAIYDRDNYIAFKLVGTTHDINWGDGTTASFASGATASKIYDSSVFAGITGNAVDGYKTLVVTAVPSGASGTTSLNLNVRHPSLISSNTISSQWLSIKMAGSSYSSITVSSAISNITHRHLRKFEFVGSPSNSLNGLISFSSCGNLRSAILGDLTKNITSGSLMFSNCFNLTEVVMNSSSMTDMSSMFSTCRNLRNGPVLNTSKVTTAASMFSTCTSLESVPLYDLKACNLFNGMFQSCVNLRTVPLFDTSNGTDFSFMFFTNNKLISVPGFSTPRVRNMNAMFQNCYSLKTIPKFDTSSVTDMSLMFSNCNALEEVPLLDTSLVTNMNGMFGNCYALRYIPKFDTRNVSNINTMMSSSGIVEFPELDFRSVTTAQNVVSSCTALVKCSNIILPICGDCTAFFSGCPVLKEVGTFFAPDCVNFSLLFSGCSSLEYPPNIVAKGHRNLATPTLTYSNMFNNCSTLRRLPLFNLSPQAIGAAVAYGQLFGSCALISEVPEYNFIGATGSANTSVLGSIFSGMPLLSRIKATNFCQSFSLPNPNMMGATALNELYTNLAAVGASGSNAKTLTVTGSLGTASDNISIATSKGWAITG